MQTPAVGSSSAAVDSPPFAVAFLSALGSAPAVGSPPAVVSLPSLVSAPSAVGCLLAVDTPPAALSSLSSAVEREGKR